MKPATLLSLACLVVGCWAGAAARVEACSCVDTPPLQARDASAAVFEGTVVDRRLTLRSQVLIFGWLPVPEDDIIVGRVWKGVSTKRVSALYLNRGMCNGPVPVGKTVLFFLKEKDGRLVYGYCLHSPLIQSAGPAIEALGAPIARFADLPAADVTVPSTPPLWRRLHSSVLVATAYYLTPPYFHPPLRWGDALLWFVVLLQLAFAIAFISRRQFWRGLPLFTTSAATLLVLLLWTGHYLMSWPGASEVLYWY
jgi:hypothetical protein